MYADWLSFDFRQPLASQPGPPADLGEGEGRKIAAEVPEHLRPLRYFDVPKANVVVERIVSFGRSRVVGKFPWLGESGKCCVSRQKPVRFSYFAPCRPVNMPLRKLPE